MGDMTEEEMAAMVSATRLDLGNSFLAAGNHEAARLAFDAVLQVNAVGTAADAARLGLQRIAETAPAELDSWLGGVSDGGENVNVGVEPSSKIEPEPGPTTVETAEIVGGHLAASDTGATEMRDGVTRRTWPDDDATGSGAEEESLGEDALMWRQEQVSRLQYSDGERQTLATAAVALEAKQEATTEFGRLFGRLCRLANSTAAGTSDTHELMTNMSSNIQELRRASCLRWLIAAARLAEKGSEALKAHPRRAEFVILAIYRLLPSAGDASGTDSGVAWFTDFLLVVCVHGT